MASLLSAGGRAARALRLLLLFVMALAAVEYLFGSILDASPLKTYLYTPLHNATQPTVKAKEKSSTVAEKMASVEKSEKMVPQEAKAPTILSNMLLQTKAVNATVAKIDSEASRQPEVETPPPIRSIVEEIKSFVSTTVVDRSSANSSELPLCDEMPPNLGPITPEKANLSLEWVETKYPEVSPGGMYKPLNCTARHKVAIIVCYRDRQQHLAAFINHMHPFLMKQQLDYGIFIVEQLGKNEFNRAKLFNVGFAESQKMRPGGWQCFIFHDVDLLPIDERNMYTCPRQPRHMSAAIDKHNFQLMYDDLFGGVSALTLEQFTKVNGFPNKYWGWGGEDDDMAYRVKKSGYHIARYKMSIARYTMLDHKKAMPNPKRYTLLSQTSKEFKKDGLSTLQYDVEKIEKHHLYTLIKANIGERS